MTVQGQEKSREVVKYPDSIMADGCWWVPNQLVNVKLGNGPLTKYSWRCIWTIIEQNILIAEVTVKR